MTEVRTQAIRRLDKLDSFPSPIAKLFCGKEFKYDPWVRAGIQTLVSRTEPLSEEEGYQLGMKDALRCAAVREMTRPGRVDHRNTNQVQRCELPRYLMSPTDIQSNDGELVIRKILVMDIFYSF